MANSTTYQSTATLSCSEGYTGGADTISCQASGAWSSSNSLCKAGTLLKTEKTLLEIWNQIKFIQVQYHLKCIV